MTFGPMRRKRDMLLHGRKHLTHLHSHVGRSPIVRTSTSDALHTSCSLRDRSGVDTDSPRSDCRVVSSRTSPFDHVVRHVEFQSESHGNSNHRGPFTLSHIEKLMDPGAAVIGVAAFLSMFILVCVCRLRSPLPPVTEPQVVIVQRSQEDIGDPQPFPPR